MLDTQRLYREFIHVGVSVDPVLQVEGNLATVPEGSILRYRTDDERIVVSDFEHGVTGDFRMVLVARPAMKLIADSYRSARANLVWKAYTVGDMSLLLERFDKMLHWHGAGMIFGLPLDNQGVRIMRAKMDIFAHRYVVYDDHGYSCFVDLEDATLDKLTRDTPGVGMFDAAPYETGTFPVT